MPHAALAPPYALIKAFVVPPEPTSYEADGEGHAYNKYYDLRFIHLHIPPTQHVVASAAVLIKKPGQHALAIRASLEALPDHLVDEDDFA